MGKKGFTMIELIVAMAVATILCASAVMIIAPIYRTYQRTTARADAQMIAGNLLDSIRKGASNAARIKAVTADNGNPGVDVGRGVYTTDGSGRLIYATSETDASGAASVITTPVFDAKYYNRKTMRMETSQAGTNRVQVTITITGDDGALAELTGLIAPVRNVLLDLDPATPEGMTQIAKDTYDENVGNAGTRPDQFLFQALLAQYGNQFPEYSIYDILPQSSWESLLAYYTAQGNATYAKALQKVMQATQTFYLATYYQFGGTGSTNYPIVYLTDSKPDRFYNPQTGQYTGTAHGSTYMIFWDGTWYAPLNLNNWNSSLWWLASNANQYPTADLLDAHLKSGTEWKPITDFP